jgi:regulator of replication initiation timing
MGAPWHAARPYLMNLADGSYGKVGTKITITETMQEYIKYVVEQMDFWHKRTTEVVEDNARLQEENHKLEDRLEKAVAAEELVVLIKKIAE